MGAKPEISVITACKNVDGEIQELYQSLRSQSCKSFEWIIIDALSSDATRDFVLEISKTHTWIRCVSEADFGFYDALNKGVQMAAADYYMVVGADDRLAPGAVGSFLTVIGETGSDVILADVEKDGISVGGFKPGLAWLGHPRVFRGSHSVGMAIRKSLHKQFGLYSNQFPLLADGFFLKLLLRSKSVHFHRASFVAGTFATDGMSNMNQLQVLAETWQIQMLTESWPYLQTFLFVAKLMVRFPRLLSDLRSQKKKFRKVI